MITQYLALAAILFCLGLYGALTKKNAIIVLISIEFMFNAAHLNLVVFNHYTEVPSLSGQVFALFSMAISGAEVAVAIAILIALFRNKATIEVDRYNEMKE